MLSTAEKNNFVLDLVQSSLGIISNNFRVVGLDFIDKKILVTVILTKHDDEDVEEIDELVSNLYAQQSKDFAIEHEIKIIDSEIPNDSYPERLIFSKRM